MCGVHKESTVVMRNWIAMARPIFDWIAECICGVFIN